MIEFPKSLLVPEPSIHCPNDGSAVIVPLTLEKRAKKGIGSMAQFSGQTGTLEKHGKNWTVAYRYRNPGEQKWRRKRVAICPLSGPGLLGPLERERRKIAVLEEAGVNTEEAIQAQVNECASGSVTFQQQAEEWLHASQTRNRNPIEEATANGYRSYLRNHLNPVIGELSLSAVDNDAIKGLVKKLHDKNLAPKTIVEIVAVAKLVVASLTANGEEVYKRTWNHDYIDLPIVDVEEQNSEAFTPEQMTQILDAAFERAVRKPINITYMLSLIVGGLGLRIGEALAIKVRDNDGCPHCKALKPRKCQHGTTFSEDCRILHVRQSVYMKKLKAPKTKNGIRDVDVPESLAAVLREYVDGKKPGKLLFASRSGNPLSQRNINRDWLHPILETVGLRTAKRWKDANGKRRVKSIDGKGTAWHAMRRFSCTHLDTELIPESLIKIGSVTVRRVSRSSRISRSWDVWIRGKNVLKMLGLVSVMPPMPPSSGLQLLRNWNKMGMFPGSSMVEHSAVNCTAEHHKPLFWRRLATKLSPLVVPQLCPRLFRT